VVAEAISGSAVVGTVGGGVVGFGRRGQGSWVGFFDADDRRPVGTFALGDWDVAHSGW
jgi:hypothetical protein